MDLPEQPPILQRTCGALRGCDQVSSCGSTRCRHLAASRGPPPSDYGFFRLRRETDIMSWIWDTIHNLQARDPNLVIDCDQIGPLKMELFVLNGHEALHFNLRIYRQSDHLDVQVGLHRLRGDGVLAAQFRTLWMRALKSTIDKTPLTWVVPARSPMTSGTPDTLDRITTGLRSGSIDDQLRALQLMIEYTLPMADSLLPLVVPLLTSTDDDVVRYTVLWILRQTKNNPSLVTEPPLIANLRPLLLLPDRCHLREMQRQVHQILTRMNFTLDTNDESPPASIADTDLQTVCARSRRRSELERPAPNRRKGESCKAPEFVGSTSTSTVSGSSNRRKRPPPE